MRAFIVAATLSSAVLSALCAPALAQSPTAYAYCLMTGPAQDCGYNSMAQCLASKRGNADFCEPNNWYPVQSERSRFRR